MKIIAKPLGSMFFVVDFLPAQFSGAEENLVPYGTPLSSSGAYGDASNAFDGLINTKFYSDANCYVGMDFGAACIIPHHAETQANLQAQLARCPREN
jgi:hypothetical protein